MPCNETHRESYLIRLWAEPNDDELVLRGWIQNVATGHKTYFYDLDFPFDLLRETAARIASDPDRSRLA
jgi:hypothetical protein